MMSMWLTEEKGSVRYFNVFRSGSSRAEAQWRGGGEAVGCVGVRGCGSAERRERGRPQAVRVFYLKPQASGLKPSPF